MGHTAGMEGFPKADNGRRDAGSQQWGWCTVGKLCVYMLLTKDLCRGCETRQNLYRDSTGSFMGGSPVYKLRDLGVE